VSLSTLRDCCKRLDVKVEDARNFARALRAISRSADYWAPELVLDIDDRRTLKRFEERSGIERDANGRALRTPTIQDFVERQCWLPRDNSSVIAFERRLMEISDPSNGSLPPRQPSETPASGNGSSDAGTQILVGQHRQTVTSTS